MWCTSTVRSPFAPRTQFVSSVATHPSSKFVVVTAYRPEPEGVGGAASIGAGGGVAGTVVDAGGGGSGGASSPEGGGEAGASGAAVLATTGAAAVTSPKNTDASRRPTVK
jgi:hypothetical protein